MTVWVGVAVLGALGSYTRYAISARWPVPWGTLAVNVTGAFALGLLIGLSVTGDALLLLGAGLLGAYTTFSTWMVESLGSLAYLPLAMAAGLAAAGLGWVIGSPSSGRGRKFDAFRRRRPAPAGTRQAHTCHQHASACRAPAGTTRHPPGYAPNFRPRPLAIGPRFGSRP